ncbi:MAG: UbiD family decarboxylase [Chloroflexi bacterium]|nr:UbiD family decarboxylase [Chloroflexota bacterium]
MSHKDLREWLNGVDEIGELKQIDGADWDLEIGAVSQLAEINKSANGKDHALLFDNVPGFRPGHRVLTNYLTSVNRFAITVNLPIGLGKQDCVEAWMKKYANPPCIKPKYVAAGPVMENVRQGNDINLLEFPVPKWYEKDGGRYIGTGCANITIDPEEGWVNLGTYRVMLVDKNHVSLYISPGHHGRIHRDKWFKQGRPFPVAISVGHDPLLYVVASSAQPYGLSEYEVAGGIKGEPIEVIKGPVTGLPIPARSEIILEGECVEGNTVPEGPFGEWTGYYASGARQEPLVTVKAVYHRNNPIITGFSGLRAPKGVHLEVQIIRSALLRAEMETAGVPGITGVWCHKEGGPSLLTAVSIRQLYPGHARQAGHLAASCRAGAYCGRYTIVVDDDIDVTDLSQVMWAVVTRSDPDKANDVIKRAWSTPLDPMISPDDRASNRYFNSRVVIDACRPYEWRDKFPPVVEISKRLERKMMKKWGKIIQG